jgi:hypothetical protein
LTVASRPRGEKHNRQVIGRTRDKTTLERKHFSQFAQNRRKIARQMARFMLLRAIFEQRYVNRRRGKQSRSVEKGN